MDRDKVAEQLTKALKGFHGKFKTMYGQVFVRIDDKTYLSTGGNQVLADIKEDAYELCDIGAGEIGTIFRNRKDINAILFGCSPDTVSVSESRYAVPVTLEDLARLTGPQLGIIPNASAASMLEGLKDASVCLIKGSGAIAAGTNCRKAVAGIQIVEKACEAEVHGRLIGGTIPISEEAARGYRKYFVNKYVKRNEEPKVDYIGFDEKEFALRSSLIDFGKQLVKLDLSYGSWGNLSVRLNDEEMLITPTSMDYFDIKIEDIVRVNINTLECGDGRVPSTELLTHAKAYRDLPDCSCMIQTRSNAISTFAACECGFALGNDKMRELIGDIMITDYATPGSEDLADTVVSTLKKTHACIIPHHGAVFYGPSLDVVLAIAEAVELKARKLLRFDEDLTSSEKNEESD